MRAPAPPGMDDAFRRVWLAQRRSTARGTDRGTWSTQLPYVAGYVPMLVSEATHALAGAAFDLVDAGTAQPPAPLRGVTS